MEVKDYKGNSVKVGSHVRVLEISQLPDYLDSDEVARIQSMKGEVLEVYEVDPYGRAWVEKWWHFGSDQSLSHSLALEAHEMELSAPSSDSHQ